jgi:rfaE bifunctional protein nucleotidyltransferase chain/domain
MYRILLFFIYYFYAVFNRYKSSENIRIINLFRIINHPPSAMRFILIIFMKNFNMNYLHQLEAKIFPDCGQFLPEARKWKEQGALIVFTNGCFDLLHRGHVEYLAKAASMGDRLVVGLNSDLSVARLKGAGRPLNNQGSRAFLLAALQFVSAVVIFGEDTPEKLIASLLPDLLVKGSDYSPEEIAGSRIVLDAGGKVETLELTAGYSTTSLIEKIRKSGR